MEPETKSSGSLVGLVVIIIILVLGGVYMWMSNNEKMTEQSDTQPTDTNAVTSQDSSEVNALEQDSSAIDVNTGIDYNAIN